MTENKLGQNSSYQELLIYTTLLQLNYLVLKVGNFSKNFNKKTANG